MEYKYKISVIIPIYNSEDYLKEAIESVINQTIGFENIQLILVNDGSTDNSEEICLSYKKQNNNVVYLKQENSGVSSARNNGIKYAEGKYINFIDSDDIWSKDALLNMYNFIEENYDVIDVVSARIKYFEASNDYHFLDYKFEKTRAIDIEEEPDMIIMHASSSLFKNDIVKNRKFDVKLKIAEDSLFINSIILEKKRYGVCREAIYNYRKRNTGNSTIQSISRNKSWYFDTPMYAWTKLIEDSISRYNKVIKYIQYILAFELKWRINCQYTILNCLEVEKHINIIKNNAKYLNTEIIENFKLSNEEEKEILKEIIKEK